jgi:starch-binding outer membrane protein, SusD/RagB family
MSIRGQLVIKGSSRRFALVLALIGLSVSAACNGFLDVDNESDILDQDLNTVQAIGPVVAGVAGDFGAMYSQTASTVAIAAFELWHTGSFPSSRQTDEGFLRRPSSDGNSGYNSLARAYWVAQDAQRRIREAFADSADRRIEMAEVLVWGGYTLHFLADNWCEATFNAGPPMPPLEVRRMAERDFTKALEIATAARSEPWRLRALAGRARAKLFLNDFAGAVADARQIPTGFVFNYNYSNNSSRENNYYAGFTRDRYRREAGVHPSFFQSPQYLSDPRTPMKDWGPTAVGPDAIRRWVEQEKYKDRDSDMLVSSWQEVRLIEAEAEIRRGNLPRAVTLINEVRAAARLPAYAGAVTEAAVTTQLRYERSAELWLQGQALFDLRRFNDPRLDVPPGQGGGTTRDKCFDIGQREFETNPNLGGK